MCWRKQAASIHSLKHTLREMMGKTYCLSVLVTTAVDNVVVVEVDDEDAEDDEVEVDDIENEMLWEGSMCFSFVNR
jgi:hypothetical protein